MTVVFLHIPKTGGTTLHTILRRQYGRGFHDENRARRGDGVPFRKMSPAQQEQVKLLKGHVRYGFHRFASEPHGVRYFTFLRNPADRVASLYRHIQRNDHHPLHAQVVPMSLDEFVSSDITRDVDNGQVRAIAGRRFDRDVCADDLEQAKQNIEDRFLYVGGMEDFDSSLAALAGRLGWARVPKYSTRNAAPSRSDGDELQPVLARVLEQNRFDTELRRWAAERFGFRLEVG